MNAEERRVQVILELEMRKIAFEAAGDVRRGL